MTGTVNQGSAPSRRCITRLVKASIKLFEVY
jgi:hypothetical protein